MRKTKNQVYVPKKAIAYSEIFLLISFSFAVAFILSEEIGTVSGLALSTTTKPGPVGGGFLGGLFSGQAFGGRAVGALTSGLLWGALVYGGALLLGNLFGLDKDQTKSVALSAGAGVATWTTISFLGKNGVLAATNPLVTYAPIIGIGVGAGIFLATYKKEKKELVVFECLPWEPPLGGQNCEKCNEDPALPCSEYRCKSLGQACELVNKGTTEEMCVWIGKSDVSAPQIDVWPEALKPVELEYVPDTGISPPNRGFKILRKPEGCLQAFTPLEFGILTDEPAQCRIDYELKNTFSEMQFLLGESNLFLKEHVQKLKIPSPFTETEGDVPEIHNDGTFNLYVRCVDANGNGEDSPAVGFSFCVDPGPDTMPPMIVGSSIDSGSPVQFDADNVLIEIYVNEPAECKWSKQDKAYDAMEHEMSCATESYQINVDLNYVCTSELTGIENRVDNFFYFRCKDKPNAPENERYVMPTSFPLVLRGTEKLAILTVGPNGTLEGGASVVEVVLTATTAHGANEGVAACFFSTNSEDSSSFIAFDTTNSHEHNQSLFLTAGNYEYFIRCIDTGGNTGESRVSFTVFIDSQEPKITRVFREGSGLKIITNEKAECAYSLTSCNFNFKDGVPLLYEDPVSRDKHFTDWNSGVTYHIKCRDLQGNEPDPTACSIVAEGAEL